MAYERVMGIHVIDEDEYQKYREGMTPILHACGGSFGFDFKVGEVLLSKTDISLVAFPLFNVLKEVDFRKFRTEVL